MTHDKEIKWQASLGSKKQRMLHDFSKWSFRSLAATSLPMRIKLTSKLVISKGELYKQNCEKRLPLKYMYNSSPWTITWLQARSLLLCIWKYTPWSNKGVFAFIILLQLRRPIECNFYRFCYFVHNGGMQWEYWSLTIYQRCPVPLKTLDIIGYCRRPVFWLGLFQHMHKITNLWNIELNWSTKLQYNSERKKTPLSHKVVCFRCLISRPQILNLRSQNRIRGKLLLSRKLCHFRGSCFSQCFILSTSPHYLSPSKVLC